MLKLRLDWRSWSAIVAISASITVLYPRTLLTLLLAPVYLVLAVLGSLVLHLAVSYGAAYRSNHYLGAQGQSGATHDPIVPLLCIATPQQLERLRSKVKQASSDISFRTPLHPTSPAVSVAIDKLLETIFSNHLDDWYTKSISPTNRSFQLAVEHCVRDVAVNIRQRLMNVDFATLGVSIILPKVTKHLQLFQEAQRSLMEVSSDSLNGENTDAQFSEPRLKTLHPGRKQYNATPYGEDFDLLLSNRYAALLGTKGLHAAVSDASLNSRPSEEKHLRQLIGDILPLVMPKREGGSSAVNVVAMEIVACAVIRPVIETLTDPDLWNKLLDEKAGIVIREQRMVNKLRAALDAKTLTTGSASPTKTAKGPKRNEDISIRSSGKQFDSYIRYLGRLTSLLEAKRIRNDIESSLRKAKQPDAFSNESKDTIVKYIDRLATAKQAVNQRITSLGGDSAIPPSLGGSTTLLDILQHPGALSFFMEYLDRRSRSMLVQFYLTVEGLKDPLIDTPNVSFYAKSTQPSVAASYTLRDDLELLLTVYLQSPNMPSGVVPIHLITALQNVCLAMKTAPSQPMSADVYFSTRQKIFAAQQHVLDNMSETDWPAFQRSELYVKAIADLPAQTIQTGISADQLRRLDLSRPHLNGRATSTPLLPSSTPSKSSGVGFAARPGHTHRAGSSISIEQSRGHRSKVSETPIKLDLSKSNELTFLTGSTSAETSEAVRTPLFSDEKTPVRASDTGVLDVPTPDEPDDLDQLATITAIQDALSSILAEENDSHSSSRIPKASFVPGSTDATAADRFTPSQSASVSADASLESSPEVHFKASVDTLGHPLRRASAVSVEGYDTDDTNNVRESAVIKPPKATNKDNIAHRLQELGSQEVVIRALVVKATHSGGENELKILHKSLDALHREMKDLEYQQRQQDSMNGDDRFLPNRTSVAIVGTSVGQAQGKNFALYLVEVHRLADDGKTTIAGWLVTRRFSEFVTLHAALKEAIPAVRNLELPQKRLVASMSHTFLQQRQVGLEKYLRLLLSIPAALEAKELRSFLSQQNVSIAPRESLLASSLSAAAEIIPGQGLIRNLLQSVTTGMDDVFGGPPMLDAMIMRLSQQAADFASTAAAYALSSEDVIASSQSPGGSESASIKSIATSSADVSFDNGATLDLLSSGPTGSLRSADSEGLTSFTAPIANLLVEVFDLKDKSSWLRRQAIIIILQQVLGGTIERKFREAITLSLAGDALLPHIEMLSDLLYPDGKLRASTPPRSLEEKLQTRESAYRKLTHLMPDIAASFIGRSNARSGARRIFSVMQNRRLNQHLVYTLLDDILSEVFKSSLQS